MRWISLHMLRFYLSFFLSSLNSLWCGQHTMANHRNEKNEMMDSRNEKEKNEMNKNWFERAHNASLQLATILAILLCYCCWFFVLCVSVGHAVWLLRIIGHYLTHRFCHFFFFDSHLRDHKHLRMLRMLTRCYARYAICSALKCNPNSFSSGSVDLSTFDWLA